jgi:tetratricopeptide (TPR) repeat protein
MFMKSRILLDAGKVFVSQGEFSAAELSLRDAQKSWTIDEDVKLFDLHYWLARCLYLQERYTEAESEVLLAIEAILSPIDAVDGYWLRADIEFAQEMFDAASESYWRSFTSAIESDSDYFVEFSDINLFADMLTCLCLVKDFVRAKELVELLPWHYDDRARLLRSIAEPHAAHEQPNPFSFETFSFETYELVMQESIRLRPCYENLQHLARHYQARREFQKSVDIYKILFDCHLEDVDYFDFGDYADVLEDAGHIEEAEKWLRYNAIVIGRGTGDSTAFYRIQELADFFVRQSRWDSATELLEKFRSGEFGSVDNDDSIRCGELLIQCHNELGDKALAESVQSENELLIEQRCREISLQENNSIANSFELAACLEKQERYLEAQTLYHELESKIRHRVSNSPFDLREYLYLIDLLFLRGRHDDLARFLHLAESLLISGAAIDIDEGNGRLALAKLLLKQGRPQDAEVQAQVALSSLSDIGDATLVLAKALMNQLRFIEAEVHLVNHPQRDWHDEAEFLLGKCLVKQGRLSEAEVCLKNVFRRSPFNSECRDLLRVCRENSDRSFEKILSFQEFVLSGKFWLESAKWETSQIGLLAQLFSDGIQWADPSYVLFTDYDVSEDDLDDALARAVAISREIQFVPEMPVMLITENIEVRLDLEGQILRAWVGERGVGVAVTIDVSNWDLHYASSDRDAMFAAGVAINWFLDCSIAIARHPKFKRLNSRDVRGFARAGEIANGWTTESQFDADIEQIVSGQIQAPPKAHRVRGHIRKLGDGLPSDEARDNAPPYIRRHMATNETWVRGHSRGGDVMGQHLLTRLQTFSSLADFLATAQRA